MAKVPKVQAGYIPARFIPVEGTRCGSCRDYITATGECMVVNDPKVDGVHGTCVLYIHGAPYMYATPKRLIPKSVVGYIEGAPDVPTHCGKCKYYEHPNHATSTCKGVGDSEDDLVQFGGCCNHYEVKEKKQ